MTERSGGIGVGNAERPIRRVGVGGRTAEFAPNALAPAQAEAVLVAEAVEWMYVFDAHDRQVARFRGTPEEVDFSDELKARTGVLGLYGESVLKDHLIVHNHPVRPEVDLVPSFPPSAADLAMVVERDLRSLIVVSGRARYEVRRPGPVWPLDEEVLADTIADLTAEYMAITDSPVTSLGDRIERSRFVLRRLREIGAIEYDHQARTGGL